MSSIRIVTIAPSDKVVVSAKGNSKVAPVSVCLCPSANLTHVALKYEAEGTSGVIATLAPGFTTVTLPCALFSSSQFTLSTEGISSVSVTLASKMADGSAAPAPIVSVNGKSAVVAEETPKKKRKTTEEATTVTKAETKKAKQAAVVEETPEEAPKKKVKEAKKAEAKVEAKPEVIKAVPKPVEAEPETVKFSNGLMYKDEVVGTVGVAARNGQRVSIRYQGMLSNGKIFDTNMPRGQLLEFTIGAGEVINGMDMSMIGMKRGGKRRMIIPPKLGYGQAGAAPAIPPNATLIFDVELVKLA